MVTLAYIWKTLIFYKNQSIGVEKHTDLDKATFNPPGITSGLLEMTYLNIVKPKSLILARF